MKTLRRVVAVGVVATFATFAFAVQAPADHTEPRLTLVIDPSQGLPGQTINVQVPDEYKTECPGIGNPINDLLTGALTALATENPGTLLAAAAGILQGGIEDPNTQGTLESVLFPLVFVDPVTQEPLSNPSQNFWDQNTGTGSIVAPATDENPDSPQNGQFLARPATYFVAAVCLGLIDITPEALAALVEAAAQQLADFLTATFGMGLPAFLGCLGGGGDLETCGGENAPAVEEEIGAILGGLIEGLINTDPEVAWVAPFCLLGGNGEIETCAVPAEAPAEPVAAAPTFAG